MVYNFYGNYLFIISFSHINVYYDWINRKKTFFLEFHAKCSVIS